MKFHNLHFFVVLLSFNCLAIDNISFSPDFIIFDNTTKSFKPAKKLPLDQSTASIVYNGKKQIFISGSQNFSIFINHNFFQAIAATDTFILEPSFLAERKTILVSIFVEGSIKNLVFSTPDPNKALSSNNSTLSFSQLKQQRASLLNNYLIGLCTILFSLLIVKYNIPDIGKYIIGIFKPGNFATRGSLLRKEGLLIIIFLAVLFFNMTLVLTPNYENSLQYSYVNNIRLVTKILLFVIGISVVNIGFHLFFGKIYKVSKLSKTYSIELLFLLMVLTLLALPLYLILFTPFINFPILNAEIFDVIVYILFFIIFLNEFYFFYIRHSVKKFYFITYICICDLIPFLIIFKLVQDLSIA